MPTEALQGYLDGLADGRYQMPLDRVFRFDEIQAAHACMEANQGVGKIVVSVV
jgi:NADPH:quinone reductase-like Zn-dependent oxidoreductase